MFGHKNDGEAEEWRNHITRISMNCNSSAKIIWVFI